MRHVRTGKSDFKCHCPGHYYEEYFGTTKSMVISPADGTIELCWGGREENGWDIYDINKPLQNTTRNVEINFEKAAPGTYGLQGR